MASDIRLIMKYIRLFDYGVPPYVILALLVVVTGVVIGLYLNRKNQSSFIRESLLCMLLGYLSFVLCATVLFRESSDTMRYCFFPFWSYDELNYKVIAQLILNVLMFVPIGFLLGAAAVKISFLQVIKLGCFLSAIIEMIQFFTRRGVCNIDDFIHNIIGCAIGFGVLRLCTAILKINTKFNLCK